MKAKGHYFEGRKDVEQEMHQMHKNRQKVEMMLSNFLQRFSPISLEKNFVFSYQQVEKKQGNEDSHYRSVAFISSYEILYVIIGCILNVLGSISVCADQGQPISQNHLVLHYFIRWAKGISRWK